MKFKTDYPGHDALYQRRKASGASGWNDEQTWQTWRKEMLDLIESGDLPKTGKVLEIGCGAGDVSLLFAERGYQVNGVDISATAIEWAKEKASNARLKANFEVGDVTNMGRWENGTFDIVVDGHCLHCIIGDDRTKVLKETFRVLKPDGMFYVSTMCGEPKEPEVIKMFDAETRCMIWDGVARRYIGKPEDILKEIEGIGFKIIKQEIQASKDTEDNLSLLLKK
jgi:ubiquinone/menaquinone biosynthesis C-methylase UbiE